MKSAAVVCRSTLFALAQAIITPPFALVALCTFAARPMTRYRIVSAWSRTLVWLARVLCGIRYRILGAEHLLQSPCIVLSKHQSTWETLAYQVVFPPQVWVLKRELLDIPFFGWGLRMMSPISIDRGSGMRALRQILEQGRDRLAQGFWIVIFPEGTRTTPGQRGKYQIGGAWLATQTNTPVLPVAVNAGTLWPKRSFLKYPGIVTISIGALLDSRGRSAEQLNQAAEAWIETEMQRIGIPGAAA
jgi:1-acyl-sn-glycerol-3-phosphate acyltransferase